MNTKLLLLHSALGTKGQFKNLKKILSNKFDVYDMDFDGHGESKSEKAFTMELFTDNVLEFLNKNKMDSINIFGYSMGGYVALNLALKAPESVNNIMTLGTKFDWTEETAEKEAKMMNPEKIALKVPAFASSLDAMHSSNDWKEVLNKTAKMVCDLGAGKKIPTKALERISHNVLIGVGSEDRMVSVEESRKSAEAIPNGRLKVIDGFQHQIEKVNQALLASYNRRFFNELSLFNDE